ncbi:MAG: class I SAM-dependent methyltransferase [Gemmataceae bacterium]
MQSLSLRPAKMVVRRLRDGWHSGLVCLGLADALTPPRHRVRVGNGDFRQTGEEFLRYFVELGGLRPTDDVLDVGCGIGRMAVPLTNFLTPPATYCGFDVMRDSIDWCRETITPRFPHFRFAWADIRNDTYNPAGAVSPTEFCFPVADASIDFAFLTSVVTHMMPDHVRHYLAELRRVVRTGGHCLITAFLMNAESRALAAAGRNQPAFPHMVTEYCSVRRSKKPEDAVAFDETWFLSQLAANDFALRRPIVYGSWAGREQSLSLQDMVVVTRE